jgi:SAM-dependent methyltransferase
MKLDMGCGLQKRDGFIGVDPYIETDYRVPMWKVPLPDGCADEIASFHSLEHVPQAQVMPCLREWHRLLAPDGMLTIEVPNLDYVAWYWLNGSDRDWAQQLMFGNQQHEGEFHECGFSKDDLAKVIIDAGFALQNIGIVWDYNQESILAVATKVQE